MLACRVGGATLIVGMVVLYGCTDSGTDPAPDPGSRPSGTTNVSFARDVLPILHDRACAECHGNDGGLSIHTVAGLLSGGVHGPAVVPGNADSSLLVRKLRTPPPFGDRMPKGGAPLPEASITVIRNWINQGAANN